MATRALMLALLAGAIIAHASVAAASSGVAAQGAQRQLHQADPFSSFMEAPAAPGTPGAPVTTDGPPPPPPPPRPSPPPPNPPPPYPPGMVMREELTNQIPANATALKAAKILLPEGASKGFTFAWVCDAKGGLYLSVNKDHMITCGPGTIDLAATLKIKGAKPIKCPDTKKACPGNTAVTVFTKFANTAEQFQAQQATFVAGLAKAASVSPLQVVVTQVKLLYTPKPSPPPAAAAAVEPAAEPAAAEPAAAEPNATVIAPAAATAKAAPAAKPAANATAAAAAPKAKPESAPLRKLLRALFQAKEAPAAPAKEEPAADAADAAPATNATEEEPPAAPETPSLDAAAVVEELPGGPKPMIEVMTSIQPLTEEEAQSVLGTTGSPYFIKTFKETLTATNLTMTDDIVTKIAEPAKEFEWPKPEEPELEANLTEPAADIPIPGITVEPANATANETAPAKSSAGTSCASMIATLAVAALGAALAL
ncbi:hypothetical protein OEZ86_013803 [Tetradesmus obliquus]|nr:hypothetical protein OEZ86_013803 [Tetradesmus obliquus]